MKLHEINTVKVTYHGKIVGRIAIGNNSCCQFEYDKDWLSDGFSISPLHLPLKSGLFLADYLPFGGNFGVFEDSLPGGYGEYMLRKVLAAQGVDYGSLTPVQRLSLVGQNGMGALCYEPEVEVGKTVMPSTLDEMQEMATLVLSERTDDYADALYSWSGNSGGVRPKSLYSNDEGHWLVKFRHIYDPKDIGLIEFRYNEAARECGIEVPDFRLMEGKYFASRRFDLDENGVRLHMATASALLNEPVSPPKMDYHSLLQLTGFLTQSPQAVEQQFRRMAFNVYAHNCDDHARNFSFICRDGKWDLAPAYDLTNDQTLGQHATSANYNGMPADEDLVTVGVNIRMTRNRCIEIINEVKPIATAVYQSTDQRRRRN